MITDWHERVNKNCQAQYPWKKKKKKERKKLTTGWNVNVMKINFNNNGEIHPEVTKTFLIQIISKCNKYCAVQNTCIVVLQDLYFYCGHYSVHVELKLQS